MVYGLLLRSIVCSLWLFIVILFAVVNSYIVNHKTIHNNNPLLLTTLNAELPYFVIDIRTFMPALVLVTGTVYGCLLLLVCGCE